MSEAGAPGSASPLLLLVSVWFEGGRGQGFRARISTTGAGGDLAVRAVTADPANVPGVVDAWLTELLAARPP
jgi:hypothetical protein